MVSSLLCPFQVKPPYRDCNPNRHNRSTFLSPYYLPYQAAKERFQDS